ncbi:MAG: alpha/beta fold hydrolase [Candidatus Thorarchaeota archaeon]|nr:MAG: alpha/beta fold hydrolase [Candidatus Thorarchaeota archaeon]
MGSIQVVPTEFLSGGEKIRGDFVAPKGEGPFPGICKFHGLPGSSDQVSGAATRLAESGYAVLTFDFRGFRRSEGLFSLAGEIEDARNAVTHLLESDMTVSDWVGVYGASYGGAVALCSAARDDRISAVCVRAPVFDTLWFARSPMIPSAVQYVLETTADEFHGFSDPTTREQILRSMVEDAKNYNPMSEIGRISPRPLLITTGDADKGIPLEGVQRLYNLAGPPKELVVVKGADHTLSTPESVTETNSAVLSWFKRVWSEATSP